MSTVAMPTDTIDGGTRDDGNHTVDEDTFQEAPHPSSAFRVVRFTVSLTNGTSITNQPIELCFHDDFTASLAYLLSL
ncbi:hypothetical protein CEP54_015443 [Fusarium duplospermum]|uniref:Uncharacterized protein n=1 Tax=Fusarium duplospermum TaxID=1325734 RepID=A0A428NP83_9HYPO|nr:hypothetical protein CEP54_015443 [Fusarium duplospermum]